MCKAEFEIPSHLKEAHEHHVTKFTWFEFNQYLKFNHFPPPHHHLPCPWTRTVTTTTANSYKKEGKEGVPDADE